MEDKKENGFNSGFQSQLPLEARKLIKRNETDGCKKRDNGEPTPHQLNSILASWKV